MVGMDRIKDRRSALNRTAVILGLVVMLQLFAAICFLSDAAGDVAEEAGVRPQHLMVAPLLDGEESIGGIEIIDQRRSARDGDGPWDEDDLKLLVLIAAQTANAISLEPYETPNFAKETKGLPAIIQKGHVFTSLVEKMHSLAVSDPLVAGNAFACTMTMDIKMKGHDRMKMSELCVYEVKDGKIVREQFHV